MCRRQMGLVLLWTCASGRMASMNNYIAFVLAGAFLIALEIFLPGGVVGVVGVAFLLAAAYVAMTTFGSGTGFALAALAILIGSLMIFAVIKLFPRSFIGRNLSLDTDLRESRANDTDLVKLLGAEGVADTVLRPAGFAVINGKRIDVVTRGDIIEHGARIRVADVEGNRVVVERI